MRLAKMRVYLEIESLRFDARLKVEEAIDPGLEEFLIPPFSLRPLLENAVPHGMQSSPNDRRLRKRASFGFVVMGQKRREHLTSLFLFWPQGGGRNASPGD
jgi:hypothetical protein